MADAEDLKSSGATHEGSNPSPPTSVVLSVTNEPSNRVDTIARPLQRRRAGGPGAEAGPQQLASIQPTVKEMLASPGDYDADILILGGGPAGYYAAIRAAQLGARTICVEKGTLGGVCLNVGCIPTKALLSSVEALDTVRRGATFGVKVGEPTIDFAAMMKRKDQIVSQLVSGVEMLFRANKIRLVRGEGKLVSRDKVSVSVDGKAETFTARNVLVCTGSVPAQLRMPGFEIGKNVWTSTEALSAAGVPKSLLVVGAGAIGLEFGYTFQRLGTDVTVVELMDQILPAADTEMASELRKHLERGGMKIFTSASVAAAEDIRGGKRVRYRTQNGEQTVDVEKVLVAVGRVPVSSGLGLEELGVKLDRGRIVVDDRMQTNIPGVYAAGDVIGEPMLAHVAWAESVVAVEAALGRPARMDYRAYPACVYTKPEMASVGMTEAQAREKLRDITIGKFSFAHNGKAMGIGEAAGFVKVISEPRYGEILGVHIVGPHATDLIAEAVVAIANEVTVDGLIHAIHPHPTLTEPIQEAAMDTRGEAIHKG